MSFFLCAFICDLHKASFWKLCRINVNIFINAYAVVGHNAKAGDFCQIDCNSAVATNAVVPDKTKVESCTLYK